MNLIERRRQMMMSKSLPSEPNYLRFTALQDSSSVSLNETGTPPTLNLEYRLNGGNWTAYTYGTTISLDTDDYIEMRKADVGVGVLSSSTSNYRKFAMTGKIAMSGNYVSLVDNTLNNENFGNYAFYNLFYDNPALVQIPNPFICKGTFRYYSMYFFFYRASIVEANCVIDIKNPNTTSIFTNTFMSCSALSQVHFNTITKGFARTFRYCSNLRTFIIDATIPPTISSDSISDIPSDCIFYVPDASVEAYKAAQYWSARADYIKGISERPVS